MKNKLCKKNLKQLVLPLLFLILGSEVFATEIWSLTKRNRGLFGYDEVTWVNIPDLGMSGNCQNPGWAGCNYLVVNDPNPDPVSDGVISEFRRNAEIKIANGSRFGSETKLVQVSGENFIRKYVVTWSATNVLHRPTETTGDGQESTISIDLTHVTI